MTAPKRVKCELCDKTMFIGKCPHNRVELDYKSLPPQTVHKYIALTKEQYDQLLAKLERAKAALTNCRLQFADMMSRVKAPDAWMIQELDEALTELGAQEVKE